MPTRDPQREDDPPARSDSLVPGDTPASTPTDWTDDEPAALSFLHSCTIGSRQTPAPVALSAYQRLERALTAAHLKSSAQKAAAGKAYHSIARALHEAQTQQPHSDFAHAAANAYQRALDLHFHEDGIHLSLGNLCRDFLDQPKRAEQCYLRAIEQAPMRPTPHIGLGDLYHLQLHEHALAETHYLRAIALDATYWYPHRQLADLYQRHLQQYTLAETHYLRALELSSHHVWTHCGLGRLYHYHLHQYARAEACYLRAIELDPRLAFPHRELGNLCHYHLRQPARAWECYLRALTLHPQDDYALRTLGTLYQDYLSQPHSAADYYHQAIAAAPGNPRAYIALAHHHETAGRWEQATTLTQQALALDPHYAAAHRSLAWLALRSQNALPQARHWSAQADADARREATAKQDANTSANNGSTSAESQTSNALLHIALATWTADWPLAHTLWSQWISNMPPHQEWIPWQNRDRIAAIFRRAHLTGQLQPYLHALPPAHPSWPPFAQALQTHLQTPPILPNPTPVPSKSPPDPHTTEFLHLLQTPDPPPVAATAPASAPR
ncbi:tetratricopeptide repeat protein [Prosthecobacter sp.]|uniref:tetratricopeptide repeat protein n=1 Tax=Prosthecobacter sp. TaxID=1965333 RepID=UPI0037850D73